MPSGTGNCHFILALLIYTIKMLKCLVYYKRLWSYFNIVSLYNKNIKFGNKFKFESIRTISPFLYANIWQP